jgi:hypothetical protein
MKIGIAMLLAGYFRAFVPGRCEQHNPCCLAALYGSSFRPEFIGRSGAAVVFHALGEKNISDAAPAEFANADFDLVCCNARSGHNRKTGWRKILEGRFAAHDAGRVDCKGGSSKDKREVCGSSGGYESAPACFDWRRAI